MAWLIIISAFLFLGAVWIVKQNHEIRQLRKTREQLAGQFDSLKRDMEEMRYAIIHDLSAPLRAVNGFSDILYKRVMDGQKEDIREFLILVRDNANVMSSMIADIREYYRVMQCPLRFEPVDMTSLFEACFQKLGKKLKADSVRFTLQPLHPVRGDHELLQIAVDQILSNALKFTNKQNQPAIQVMQEQGFICITDNGAGFDMSFSDKAFKLFQRLHLKDQFGGNGAGLAIARRIILRHGGSIRIESETGQGTRVYFKIPDTVKRT